MGLTRAKSGSRQWKKSELGKWVGLTWKKSYRVRLKGMETLTLGKGDLRPSILHDARSLWNRGFREHASTSKSRKTFQEKICYDDLPHEDNKEGE